MGLVVMRSFLPAFFLALIPVAASAQEAAESFIPNFAAGGAYGLWSSEADFDERPGSLQLTEAGFNAPVPLIQRDDFFALAGVRFRYNELEVDGFAPIDGSLDLYRLQIPFNFWWSPSEKWKFWFRLEPGLHSDFENLDSDDFVLTTLALASYRLNPALRIAFGAYYSRDLGDETVLPALGFIYEPNRHWIFSITAPRLYASYAPADGLLFTAFAYPGGGGWNVTDPVTGEDYDLDYQNLRAGLSAEKQIAGPFWGYLEGGYQFLQQLDSDLTGEFDAEGSWFATGGVQLRF